MIGLVLITQAGFSVYKTPSTSLRSLLHYHTSRVPLKTNRLDFHCPPASFPQSNTAAMSDNIEQLNKWYEYLILPALPIQNICLPEDGNIACFRDRLQRLAFASLLLRLNMCRDISADKDSVLKLEERATVMALQLLDEVEDIGTAREFSNRNGYYDRQDLRAREKVESVGEQMVESWFVKPLTKAFAPIEGKSKPRVDSPTDSSSPGELSPSTSLLVPFLTACRCQRRKATLDAAGTTGDQRPSTNHRSSAVGSTRCQRPISRRWGWIQPVQGPARRSSGPLGP